jgi:hypothetical protein
VLLRLCWSVQQLVVGGAETQLSYLDIARLSTDTGFATG